MASKRRLRRKACTGKVRHKAIGDSYIHVKKLAKRGFFLAPYRCKHCGFWHVGHNRKLRSIENRLTITKLMEG